MQKFKFPMEYLRVTQGENDSYSHAGSLAMDFAGKDTGADRLYCPCDMMVKRCRKNANGELYLESTLPVEFADGTTDYARLLCMHDNAFNVVEGQVLKQGDYFYDEGGMGSGKANKFSTHVHIEAGKGKWKSCTQAPNSKGTYVIENQSHLYDLFILGDDVVIKDGGGYPWKRVSELKEKAENNAVVYGVDVSDHRSAELMKKIRAFGKARFVIFRATIGSVEEDTDFAQYLKDSEGMKKGFFSANYFNTVEDAIAEADYLVDTVEKYGFTPWTVELPLFCDWEGFSYRWNKEHGIEITPVQLREMTEAFCNRIKERGYKAGVYLNLDFWNNWYGSDFFIKNPDLYIWYARPGIDKPDRDCYIWQYACNNGAEYGVNEDLDKNILLGDYIEAPDINIGSNTDKDTNVPCKECEKMKGNIAQLEEQLAETEEKIRLAAEQIQADDFYITKLKLEKEELKEKVGKLTVENSTLKETIVSLKEQLSDVQEKEPEKSLFERILDIIFGGA